jgi:lipoate-protein ligase A
LILHWFDDGAHPGAHNMARDRRIWRRAEAALSSDPILMLYGWDPPAVSLGYHQDAADLDERALAAAGIDVVRRPTGGAAVLHQQELTYAVVARLDTGFGRGIHEIYETVAQALVSALAAIGVEADRTGQGRPAQLACFAAAGGHEITVHGRKLVGSALRRGRRAFLQHGSILTGPAHVRLAELVRAPESERRRLRDRLRRSTTDLQALGVGDPSPLGPALALALAEASGATASAGARSRLSEA